IRVWLAVSERSVAEAEAERIKRLAVEVAVGAPRHGVIVEWRELVDRFVESDGQAASRTEITGKRFRYSRAARNPPVPSFENRRNIRVCPIDAKRAPVH